VPAIPPCIQEPLWDQVTALLPPRQVHHLLGCHRQRIPDRVVFDKLIQILVFGCGYRCIADHTCSATTLRRRRDEWIALGVADQLHRLTLAAYDRLHCLDLEHLAVDGCITKALRWPGRRAPHGDAAAWSGPLVGSCCLPCSRAGPHLEPVGKGWPSRDARLGRRPPSHTGGRDGRSRPGRLDTARIPGRTAAQGGHLADGRRGRPPWCPLAPSSRPSRVSILDGCPGGYPSGCPAVGLGASIPTACRVWKRQENKMSGR
jgi:transposase